jgi:hypothetical protein
MATARNPKRPAAAKRRLAFRENLFAVCIPLPRNEIKRGSGTALFRNPFG